MAGCVGAADTDVAHRLDALDVLGIFDRVALVVHQVGHAAVRRRLKLEPVNRAMVYSFLRLIPVSPATSPCDIVFASSRTRSRSAGGAFGAGALAWASSMSGTMRRRCIVSFLLRRGGSGLRSGESTGAGAAR